MRWSVHERMNLAGPAVEAWVSKSLEPHRSQGKPHRSQRKAAQEKNTGVSLSSCPPRCFAAILAVKGFSEKPSLLTNRPG
jgi:hypothetical protein